MGTIKTLLKTGINLVATPLSYGKGLANETADYIENSDSWLHDMSKRSIKDNHAKFRDIGQVHGKVAIDYTTDACASAWDTVTDAFTDDTKPVVKKPTGYGSFGK